MSVVSAQVKELMDGGDKNEQLDEMYTLMHSFLVLLVIDLLSNKLRKERYSAITLLESRMYRNYIS